MPRKGIGRLRKGAQRRSPSWPSRQRRTSAAPGWVVDGNYSAVRDLVWSRADTVIWLDLPRWRVMRQVIWRTLRRIATSAELWNGNRENWRNLFGPPEESIIVWAWTRHRVYRDRYLAAQVDPANDHLRFVRLRTGRQVSELLLAAECVDRGDLAVTELEAE